MIIQYRKQLPDLLRELNLPMIAAEIGVAEGFNAADLLRNGIEKLYMVDSWTHIPGITGDGNFPQHWHDKNYRAAKKRVEEFGERAVMLRGKSSEMASHVEDESLSLLYIDADHSYWGVLTDLALWVPKVRQGGVVALHDYENAAYGVKPAVRDFCNGHYEIQVIPEDKIDDAGAYFIKT